MALDIEDQYDKIYRYCYLKIRQRETAEDITQETFLRFLEHPKYYSIDKTMQILYTIAGNLCMDEFRKQKCVDIPETQQSDEDIEETVLSSFLLKNALKILTDTEREIILLRYINDVPVNVIGNIYDMSRFAVNRRIKSILEKLKKEMGGERLI
ncbi:MAG: sigma-70 family RNA polymerase sigma factor [Ruminococcus sp.]|nr:sigma-70 family RNA polymerase sigma factor [Ruminococcus sp.]